MEWTALSPDGKLFAFSYSNEVMLWETRSTQAAVVIVTEGLNVSVLAFSPNGKVVVTGDSSCVVKVWDVTSKELSTFKGHKDGVTALAFSPDGRTLASGGYGAVKLFDMASMRELITLTHMPSATSESRVLQGGEDAVIELFFSSDGRSLITRSGNKTLRIWRGASDADVSATAR